VRNNNAKLAMAVMRKIIICFGFDALF